MWPTSGRLTSSCRAANVPTCSNCSTSGDPHPAGRTCGISRGNTCCASATTSDRLSAATRALSITRSFHPTAARSSRVARMAPCGSGRSPPAGRFARSLPHATDVNGAAFAPDGRTLATVSDDGKIKLWDVETGVEQATIPAHKGDVIAVRFTPDGRRLISAGRNDCLVKLWDLTTKKELALTQAHEGAIESMALSPDGTTLATVGGDGYARLWNLADLSLRKSLSVNRGPVLWCGVLGGRHSAGHG